MAAVAARIPTIGTANNNGNSNDLQRREQQGRRGARTNGGRSGKTAVCVGHSAIPMGGANAQITPRRPKLLLMRRIVEKPRQEICAPLKWTCFLANFIIFLASVACLALGLYLFLNDPRPVSEIADFLLNPSVLIASIGLTSGIVALFGLFGALRDNVLLLKLFALCVFLAYLLLVICTCLLFLMFYADANGDSSGISAQSLLLHSINRYHANKNIADFMDYLQEQLECCGSTSFRDWHLSEQYQCNATNPFPERCGVPFSCCRRSVVSGAGGSDGDRVHKPLVPAMRSIQCWQNAQKKREQELDSDIHVGGCLQPLRALFDAHALHIGMGVVSVILPVCLGVCLSQCLARQIDYQHFLLNREQRRIERRERRERRYQEQQSAARKKHSVTSQSELMERGELNKNRSEMKRAQRRPKPPQIPLPPVPRDAAEEEAILSAVLQASKIEFERDQRNGRLAAHQKRAASFSPMQGRIEANNAAKEKHPKRKSMILEVENGLSEAMGKRQPTGKQGNEQNDRKEGKRQKKAAASGSEEPREAKSNKKGSQKANQHNAGTEAAAARMPAPTTNPTNRPETASRNVPSAPPISLILQQHHFN